MSRSEIPPIEIGITPTGDGRHVAHSGQWRGAPAASEGDALKALLLMHGRALGISLTYARQQPADIGLDTSVLAEPADEPAEIATLDPDTIHCFSEACVATLRQVRDRAAELARFTWVDLWLHRWQGARTVMISLDGHPPTPETESLAAELVAAATAVDEELFGFLAERGDVRPSCHPGFNIGLRPADGGQMLSYGPAYGQAQVNPFQDGIAIRLRPEHPPQPISLSTSNNQDPA